MKAYRNDHDDNEKDEQFNFIELLGEKVYYWNEESNTISKQSTQMQFMSNNFVGLFFCAAWSKPCQLWGSILSTIQTELQERHINEIKLLCIIVPMCLESEREQITELSKEFKMPFMWFDDHGYIQNL